MEVVGLAVSIPPLVSLCLEVLDRVRDFKEYKSNSRQLSTRFSVAKFRLKEWVRTVGIIDGKLADQHHPRLDQREVAAVVATVLNCLHGTFTGAHEIDDNLLRQHNEGRNVPEGFHAPRRTPTVKSGRSAKSALYWSLRQKSAFTEQVDMFEILVDRLYDLVPLDQDSKPAVPQTIMSSVGLDQIEFSQQEILLIVKELRQESMRKMYRVIDDWLDTPIVDQEFEKQKNTRLKGTCDWLFENTSYVNWELDDFTDDNTNAKLFWLCGPPGHGKTILCATITDRISKLPDCPTAFFFSTPHVQSGHQPHHIVRSWISQLVRNDDLVFDLVRDRVTTQSSSRHATRADIWALFHDVISTTDNCTLILDGFDEFPRINTDRREFLADLKKHSAGTRTRILITSRPEDDIESELSSTSTCEGLSIEGRRIELADLETDIALYAKTVVNEQLPKKDDELRRELAQKLSRKCEGMFLWIKLQRPQLRDGKSKKRLIEVVDQMPDGLAQTYTNAWTRILTLPEDDKARAIEILRWVTFSKRALTVEELAQALVHNSNDVDDCQDDMPDEIDEGYIDGEIKGLCGSLIDIRPQSYEQAPLKDYVVQVVHVSARDFLVNALPVSPSMSVSAPETQTEADHHMHLAEVCTRYLNCGCIASTDSGGGDAIQQRLAKGFASYAHWGWRAHQWGVQKPSEEYLRLTSELFRPENPRISLVTAGVEFWVTPWTERRQEIGSNSVLYCAVAFGLDHIIDELHHTNQIDFSPVSFTSGTTLILSVWDYSSLFEKFLEWGADINTEAGEYGSALGAAVAAGNQDKARILIGRGANLKIRDWRGRSILSLACMYSNVDMVQLLLDHGADPSDFDDNFDRSPLWQSIQNDHLKITEMLLDHGASFTTEKDTGLSALHSACERQCLEVVELLIDRGADLATKVDDGSTPLHSACRNSSPEIVAYLLEKGAVLSAQTNDGQTPLHSASIQGRTEIVQLLLQGGADINAQDHDGNTPLHYAAVDHLETTRLLLEQGANPDVQAGLPAQYYYPIHAAADGGKVEIVQLFIEQGISIHSEAMLGFTPIWNAIHENHVDVADELINAGADLIFPITWAETVIEWARKELDEVENESKLIQWESKVTGRLLDADREWYVKREICRCADMVLNNEPSKITLPIFSWLEMNFRYLKAGPDIAIASKHQNLEVDSAGRPIHDAFCNACVPWDSELIHGDRWICVECRDIDFCSLHKDGLADLEDLELRKCAGHELVLITGTRDEGFENECSRVNEPGVREWLEGVLLRFRVEGPEPGLVPLEQLDLDADNKEGNEQDRIDEAALHEVEGQAQAA